MLVRLSLSLSHTLTLNLSLSLFIVAGKLRIWPNNGAYFNLNALMCSNLQVMKDAVAVAVAVGQAN